MLKLKNSHFPLVKSRKHYEEDPDAPALEADIESEIIDGVQQALTQGDEDDLFGDCVLCRQPIAEERLKHLPWAAYCNACDLESRKQDSCLHFLKAA